MEGQSQGLRKGTWTAEEDSLLRKCIEKYGEGKWHQVPSRAGLNRCRKSCRLRWLNYLKPSIKRGKLSPDEVDLVIRLHKLLGNRWSLIAGRLPGRTANDVKNYWNTHLSKKQDQSSNRKTKQTCKKNIFSTPTKPVTKIDVIKPRPRSFSENSQRWLPNATPEISFPGSNTKDGGNATNKKTCDSNIVNEGREIMWWESLLEESEGAATAPDGEEENITAAAVVEAEESSWMNSAAAMFDVDLWNLLNA